MTTRHASYRPLRVRSRPGPTARADLHVTAVRRHPPAPRLTGEQYTGLVFTAHLIDAGVDASIGTVGDALDNAVIESTHGGKMAMLGLLTEDFRIDWTYLVPNMITIKGIYGRQMFETW